MPLPRGSFASTGEILAGTAEDVEAAMAAAPGGAEAEPRQGLCARAGGHPGQVPPHHRRQGTLLPLVPPGGVRAMLVLGFSKIRSSGLCFPPKRVGTRLGVAVWAPIWRGIRGFFQS